MKKAIGKKIGKAGQDLMIGELTRVILTVRALEDRVAYLESVCGPRGCLLAWTRTGTDGVPYYVGHYPPHAAKSKGSDGEVFG